MVASTSIVVIGGSAGAIGALGALLPALPAGFGVPVVVVVHLPARPPTSLVDLFRRRCAVDVREPNDKEPIGPGIYFAPPSYHLLIEADQTFSLSIEAPVNYSRPSIDLLFESAAEAFGEGVVAVVLTGASVDGARGAETVRAAGGYVVVQAPESADAATMPRAAIRLAEPQMIGALVEIAESVSRLARVGPQ